jgi:SNF2 family DNA or RNA helicase
MKSVAFYDYVFDDAQETVKEIFKTTTNISAKNMQLLECLLRARQCCIWPQMYYDGVAKKNETEPETWVGMSRKMETLFQMIESHPDEKALVFCQFTGEMDHIQRHLEGPVLRIDGSVSKENRLEQMRLFKNAPNNAVLIIQIKSGGQGLNLQEATRVYITAPSWNPATELQAVGRSHRSGQTKTVYVKKFVYAGTVEEDIMALQVTSPRSVPKSSTTSVSKIRFPSRIVKVPSQSWTLRKFSVRNINDERYW